MKTCDNVLITKDEGLLFRAFVWRVEFIDEMLKVEISKVSKTELSFLDLFCLSRPSTRILEVTV